MKPPTVCLHRSFNPIREGTGCKETRKKDGSISIGYKQSREICMTMMTTLN